MKLNNTNNLTDIIKSVRGYEENGLLKMDFRVHANAKLPKGKVGNRFRSSTGKAYSALAMKSFEKHKFELAQEHYESLFDNLENTDEPTFGAVAELALSEAEADRRKSDGTKDYLRILHREVKPTFWEMKLVDIKPSTIKAWQVAIGTKKSISQSRFNKIFYVLKRVLDYSIENSYIETNPISYVKRSSKLFKKQQKKDDNYFSKEQMRLILDDTCEDGTAIDKAKHAFINTYMYVAFFTGARVGELASLTFENISFEDNLITFSTSIRKGVLDVTKTDEVRTVPMVKELADVLLKFKGNSDRSFVFINPKSGSYYRDTRSIVDTYYKPMLKRLKLPPINAYQTRATFASIAMEKGVPISTISKCLGHKSTEITSRFYLKFGKISNNDIRDQLENLSA